PFAANGREYPAGTWVILMDQPFSALVKELLETQQYPEIRESPNGPPIRPYDVAGWTLPMQMGVQVAAVLQPVTQEQRAGLMRLERFAPPAGKIDGTGAVYVVSHKSNAAFKTMNEVFAGGGQVSFSGSDIETPEGTERGAIVISGVDGARMARIARE